MGVPILVMVCVLAGVIGFAVHRASLCTVQSVGEILTSRRAYMLAAFVKTALWVIGITLIIAWVAPFSLVVAASWKLTMYTIGGGFLFGVGAAINGGCAFSTLTRLSSGDLGMIISLVGFLVGAGAYGIVSAAGPMVAPVETAVLSLEGRWRATVTTVLVLWMVWELIRLVRSARGRDWRQRILASRYRLSTAAALMGFSNAVLYGLIGVWSYTGLFGQAARHVSIGTPSPDASLWILFVALVIGMGLSAWQGRRFRWQWRPNRKWFVFGAGGVLMGTGAAMIPGGNDVLILHGIPSLSPHAVPAFLAMLVGIAVPLMGMRALGQDMPRIDCGGDICTTEPG